MPPIPMVIDVKGRNCDIGTDAMMLDEELRLQGRIGCCRSLMVALGINLDTCEYMTVHYTYTVPQMTVSAPPQAQ